MKNAFIGYLSGKDILWRLLFMNPFQTLISRGSTLTPAGYSMAKYEFTCNTDKLTYVLLVNSRGEYTLACQANGFDVSATFFHDNLKFINRIVNFRRREPVTTASELEILCILHGINESTSICHMQLPGYDIYWTDLPEDPIIIKSNYYITTLEVITENDRFVTNYNKYNGLLAPILDALDILSEDVNV